MGDATAVIGWLGIALAWSGPSQDSSPKILPRTPIAGLAGFESVSRLIEPSEPDRPRRLRATYVFPDRVRWQLSRIAEETDRTIEYRYGEGCFRIAAGGGSSTECSGAERAERLLHMELRRAVWLYPDGFAWKDAGSERRVELAGLGTLFVRTGPEAEARPTEIGDMGPDGQVIDVFKQISWRKQDGRAWPASLELWHGGVLAWRETVESIDVAGRFIDSFFLPPDRRAPGATEPLVESTRSLELPATCSLRIDVPKGTSWDAVVSGFSKHAAEWSRRLADAHLALDSHATVEITDAGEPVAWILRLTSVPVEPPEGFATSAARTGISLAVRGFEGLTEDRIATLRQGLPRGSSSGRPYVRFDPGATAGGTVLVVLPYLK